MSLGSSDDIVRDDERFAAEWRVLSWEDAHEVDVREELLTPLLIHLGYRRGTIADIKREDKFALSQPFLMIGRQRIEIDYAPRVRLKRFFIVETKSPQDDLDHGVLLQALFYAYHPEVRARYVCLCNGVRLEVFAVGSEPHDTPVLVIDQAAVSGDQVRQLRLLLGAKTIAASLRRDTIEALRETLEVEVDERAVAHFDAELRQMMTDGRAAVRRNAAELKRDAWKRQGDARDLAWRQASFETILIWLDNPMNAQLRYGSELGRRLSSASLEERTLMVDKLAITWRSRVHGVFRVHCTTALLTILGAGETFPQTTYVTSVEKCVDELAMGAMSYWEGTPLSLALCHLDNVATRVSYKLAKKLGAEAAAKMLEEQRRLMAADDVLADFRSSAGTVLSTGNLIGEFWFWRRFNRGKSSDEIYAGVCDLETLEQVIETLPGGMFPPGDGSVMFFEYYGRGLDMLRMGTWDALRTRLALVDGSAVSAETKAFAALTREQALSGIPPSPARSAEWTIRDEFIRKLAEDIRPK